MKPIIKQWLVEFYGCILHNAAASLCIGILLVVLMGAGVVGLVKDTSVNAFISADHPSVLSREKIKHTFGLQDPLVISLQATEGSVFTPQGLNRLYALHHAIQNLPMIRQNGVKSLVSEKHICGDGESLLASVLLDAPIASQTQADAIKAAVREMSPFVGTLVAYDYSSVAIIAELIDEASASQAYAAVSKLAGSGADIQVHVAGQGAVSGYLSEYIDKDSRKMQPLVFLVVLSILFFAFRRWLALIGPVFIIVAAVVGCLGAMGYAGIPYYAITSALPVVVTAIAVADAIHILTAYYRMQALHPEWHRHTQISRAMLDVIKPITFTTMTTIAGFAGLSIASIMPPISAFGWFAAVGVLIAWGYSLVFLPCIIALLKLPPSPVFTQRLIGNTAGRKLAQIATFSAGHPGYVLLAIGGVVILAGLGASQLTVDRAQIENFTADEPIRIATDHLNHHYAGTAYLDVVIDTQRIDGALEPELLAQVNALQDYLHSLEHVQKTLAITDYLALLHRSLTPDISSDSLPHSADAIAQYLLLYESSSDATDFRDELDNQYQQLLIRAYLNSRYFSEEKQVVEALQTYVHQHFSGTNARVQISGRVNVDYHWMMRLQASHFLSIGLSLGLILLCCSAQFGSVKKGVVALLPILVSVLAVYGVMGWQGIFLEPTTAMFAAIAIGVGVDFAIHILERLDLDNRQPHQLDASLRACFFNAFALSCGFATLMLSELPTIARFGFMITLACSLSFVLALLIVPMAMKVVNGKLAKPVAATTLTVAGLLCSGYFLVAGEASANTANDGLGIATKVWQRPDAEFVTRDLAMRLVDHNGNVRERQARVSRANEQDSRRTLIRFTSPRRVKNSAFLTLDYAHGGQADQQWMYLPALKKARRIPAANRGDSFMGTDFSYEELKSEFKFSLDDYDFEQLPSQSDYWHLRATPKTAAIAKELGIGQLQAHIDPVSLFPRQITFLDKRLQRYKTLTVTKLNTALTYTYAEHVVMENHQTGHRTEFVFSNVSFPSSIPPRTFNVANLERSR